MDIKDHWCVLVLNRWDMTKEELKSIYGGAGNANLFNAIARGIITLYELGRACGSALKYAINKKKCT